MNKIIAIILVGGKSSRMGSDKASLIINGIRLIDYIAKIIISSGISNIITSGKIEGYIGISDLIANKGPVGGICSTLIHYHNLFEKALIIPVDMPLISADLIKTLIISSASQTAVHFKNNPLPLLIKIDQLVIDHCLQINSDFANKKNLKDLSVKSFLKKISTLELQVPEKLIENLTNINTKEQWKNINLIQHEYKNR